jgi:hypothetical protein
MRPSGDLTVSVMGHHSAVICDQNRPVTRQTDVSRQDVDVVIGLAASHQRVAVAVVAVQTLSVDLKHGGVDEHPLSCSGEH